MASSRDPGSPRRPARIPWWQWAAVLAGALAGAALGQSRWLCADGSCPLTGSWYGGMGFGLVAGWLLADVVREFRDGQLAARRSRSRSRPGTP